MAKKSKPRAKAKPKRQSATAAASNALPPIHEMMSSRLLVLANLLARGAILHYKRIAGLSLTECGVLGSLGEQAPMSVATLADAMGRDKGQISRALAGLVSRKLVARSNNPDDSRESLISLTKTGLAAHDKITASALERNRQLAEHLSAEEIRQLLHHLDRLTENANRILAKAKRP